MLRPSLFLPLVLVLLQACAPPSEVHAAPALYSRPLFDGKSLAGWVTSGGRYDGTARWSVEEGALTGRVDAEGRGGLIYTDRPYTEFVLTLECRLDYPFDSGIFLRMAPHGKGLQITLDDREGGEIGAIYADGFLKHNPDGVKLWKRNEWNQIEVRSTGRDARVAVQLNGQPLVDYQLPSGSEGYAPTGLIGLQVHGDRKDPPSNACRFKNVRIEELSQTSTQHFVRDEKGVLTPTAWGRAQGWTSLFDGTSLAGLEPVEGKTGFEVRDGEIALLTQGDAGYLRTQDDYQDFALRLDFKIAEMTNSGLFLRGDRAGGDPAWTGCEVQILDDFNWERVTNSKLKEWQFTGSLYGSVAPAKKALRPLGEWNTYEIEYRGSRIRTLLNGQVLYDVDTHEVSVPADHLPFEKRAPKGFLGLQRHAPDSVKGDAYAWFRNWYVRTL